MELDQFLYEYGKSDYYPFHMPGHKRRFCPDTLKNPYLVDITEIDGFDNLHHPEGILKEAQERAARLYGARETYYLVNGSTAGILSALSAAVSRGGMVLMARNCHKAAYHGAYLRNLKVKYLYPSREESVGLNGGISARQVEENLRRYPETEAVFLTSPTYDGVVSHVEEIAKVVHARGIPLIVDEAHGAHFAFSDYFPVSALDLGADVVIQSLHKTLPSMTQTALLHRNSDRVSRDLLRRFLGIYQSSSPSYLFMAGMEACVRWIRKEGKAAFGEYTERLERFRREMEGLRHLHLLSPEDVAEQGNIFVLDKSKLIITTAGTDTDGQELAELLMKSYHIQMEMSAPGYVLALCSVMDTEEGFFRLREALLQIDSRLHGKSEITRWNTECLEISPSCTITEGMESSWEEVPFNKSRNRVSAEFISLYPPGIPCLVPGERITARLLEDIEEWKQMGLDIQGPSDYTLGKIRVLKDL